MVIGQHRSGDGLLLNKHKPLPEQMVTNDNWHHMVLLGTIS